MESVRAKQILVTVAAMLSLLVSAVSACACSHHEPVNQAVESSCHGPSHEAPAIEQPSLLGTHIESDCNCFVRTPVPAIAGKKDDKRTAIAKHPVELFELPTVVPIQLDSIEDPKATFEPRQSDYQHALLASLPSRAPPRR